MVHSFWLFNRATLFGTATVTCIIWHCEKSGDRTCIIWRSSQYINTNAMTWVAIVYLFLATFLTKMLIL